MDEIKHKTRQEWLVITDTNKRIWLQLATKQRKYHGFNVHSGYVIGCDEKSPFVCPRIVGGSGLMLWRQDLERGWYECWESSESASAILRHWAAHTRTQPIGSGVRAGYVRNYGHARIFK